VKGGGANHLFIEKREWQKIPLKGIVATLFPVKWGVARLLPMKGVVATLFRVKGDVAKLFKRKEAWSHCFH
jgi:hypothetical protein